MANLEGALRGGSKLGVTPVLESRDIARWGYCPMKISTPDLNIICSPNVEYLGVMAWAAAFQWIEDKHGPGDLVEVGLYHL